MGSIGKVFSLLLIVLLAVASLIILAKPALAQTPTPTSTPTTPEQSAFPFQDVIARIQPISPADNASYSGNIPINMTVRFLHGA